MMYLTGDMVVRGISLFRYDYCHTNFAADFIYVGKGVHNIDKCLVNCFAVEIRPMEGWLLILPEILARKSIEKLKGSLYSM